MPRFYESNQKCPSLPRPTLAQRSSTYSFLDLDNLILNLVHRPLTKKAAKIKVNISLPRKVHLQAQIKTSRQKENLSFTSCQLT